MVYLISVSPYAHVLHTNYVPPDSELHEIKAFLLNPETELRRLETELTRIRAILDDLVSEHDKLNNFVDAHKALISPVRRLPPEILQEIFIRCLTTRNSVMHRSEAPMLLTEVCVEWRRIALSTPALWSTLHLPFPGSIGVEEVPNVRFDVAKAWLTRSGELPLSISVYDMNWTIRRSTFLDLLGPFIHRCRVLRFSILNPDVNQLNSLVLPLLEEITIADWYPQTDSYLLAASQTNSYAFLKGISSLKKATLLGCYNLEPGLHLPSAQFRSVAFASLHDDPYYTNSSVGDTQKLSEAPGRFPVLRLGGVCIPFYRCTRQCAHHHSSSSLLLHPCR